MIVTSGFAVYLNQPVPDKTFTGSFELSSDPLIMFQQDLGLLASLTSAVVVLVGNFTDGQIFVGIKFAVQDFSSMTRDEILDNTVDFQRIEFNEANEDIVVNFDSISIQGSLFNRDFDAQLIVFGSPRIDEIGNSITITTTLDPPNRWEQNIGRIGLYILSSAFFLFFGPMFVVKIPGYRRYRSWYYSLFETEGKRWFDKNSQDKDPEQEVDALDSLFGKK